MSKPEDLEQRLGAMNDAFQNAKTFTRGELPPDGTYQGLIHRFDYFEAKRTGHLFLKTEIQIQFEDDWEGQTVEVIHNLEDPDRVGSVKQHLRNCGLELDDLSQLDRRLHELLDVPVEFAVKTSTNTDDDGNPYRNVYVNKRLGNPMPRADVAERADIPVETPELTPAAAGGNPDDDIPF